jgi:hypothetical protein
MFQGDPRRFEIHADDVVDIREYFIELKDPRSTGKQKHLLRDLIVICVLATIAGADVPNSIGIWANSHRDWLSRHRSLPGGIPSHDTIGRLLAALQPQAFQSCFEKWIAAITSDIGKRPAMNLLRGKSLRSMGRR